MLFLGVKSHSQDSLKVNWDSLVYTFPPVKLFTSFWEDGMYEFYHSPTKQDKRVVKKYSYLLHKKPMAKNHHQYYRLACSLWELERLDEAASMFHQIVNSNEPAYTSTYYHSSDVPGDTTTNLYGYGSYTSSYKNSAAQYLARIYIEKKIYDSALKYLDDAVHVYKVEYTCGTGFHWQQDRYRSLYVMIYDGQKEYRKVLELFAPETLLGGNRFLVKAVQQLYSKDEIREQLRLAEDSFAFTPDTEARIIYQTTYDSNGAEKEDSFSYYSATVETVMFGYKINVSTPHLVEGDRLTREQSLAHFKESTLYTSLMEYIKPSSDD